MILASGSPRRLELLRQMGFSPVVRPANIDETPLAGESPTDLVLRLARQKARACEKDLPKGLRGQVVVAADTTVWIDGLELGKPKDDEDARAMLSRLSGRTHHVSTGVCVLAAEARVVVRGDELRHVLRALARADRRVRPKRRAA
jgi:septum formation protein